jgi:hypothetical protein
MIFPTFKIVKCVLGLMILEITNRRNIPRKVHLVEIYKPATLSAKIFVRKFSPKGMTEKYTIIQCFLKQV